MCCCRGEGVVLSPKNFARNGWEYMRDEYNPLSQDARWKKGREDKIARIRKAMQENPSMGVKQLAKLAGVSVGDVSSIYFRIKRGG